MKTKTKTIATLAVTAGLVVVVGCLPSLNPVYTDNDLVFEPALLGTWSGEKSGDIWDFRRQGEKEYLLTYTDKQGRSGRFQAHLARIGDVLFLDLFPVKRDIEANAFYQFHLVPIHSVYIVEKTESGYTFRGMDNRWLDEYLTSHPDELPYATYNGHKVVTASTSQLQSFVLQHRDRFTVNFHLVRKSG